MSLNMIRRLKRVSFALLVFSLAILLAGCSGGGGGGGGGGGVNPLPSIHTDFSNTPARIQAFGVAYDVSISVRETRGDPVEINALKTSRTLIDASGNNVSQTSYYSGAPDYVRGWMFAPTGSTDKNFTEAVINDTSSSYGRTIDRLLGYETRTIRTQVMIGQPYQSRPAGFYGLFIINSQYKEWLQSGRKGIRYWVRLEGYDYKINDTYNINMPIEIWFDYNPYDPFSGGTSGTDPYDPFNGGTGTSTGTGTNTDPYNPF